MKHRTEVGEVRARRGSLHGCYHAALQKLTEAPLHNLQNIKSFPTLRKKSILSRLLPEYSTSKSEMEQRVKEKEMN